MSRTSKILASERMPNLVLSISRTTRGGALRHGTLDLDLQQIGVGHAFGCSDAGSAEKASVSINLAEIGFGLGADKGEAHLTQQPAAAEDRHSGQLLGQFVHGAQAVADDGQVFVGRQVARHGSHGGARLHEHDIAVGNKVLCGVAGDAILLGLVDDLLADIERLSLQAPFQPRGPATHATQPAGLL